MPRNVIYIFLVYYNVLWRHCAAAAGIPFTVFADVSADRHFRCVLY
jgi:hypothetical protein